VLPGKSTGVNVLDTDWNPVRAGIMGWLGESGHTVADGDAGVASTENDPASRHHFSFRPGAYESFG